MYLTNKKIKKLIKILYPQGKINANTNRKKCNKNNSRKNK